MTPEKRDQLVERIRVACFEAPKAHSHSEWKRRIEAILDEAAEPDPDVASTTTLEGRVFEVKIPLRRCSADHRYMGDHTSGCHF